MKSKKGDVIWENMPGTIIAALGALIIAVLIYAVYNLSVSNEEKTAQTALNTIADKVNGFKDNPQAFKFTTRGPADWYLYGWGKNDPTRPERCLLSSCICVCPSACPISGSCPCDGGICRNVDFNDVSVKSPRPYIVATGYGCLLIPGVAFPSNFVEIRIDNKKSITNSEYKMGTNMQIFTGVPSEGAAICDKFLNDYITSSANEAGAKDFVSIYSLHYTGK